MGFLPAEELMDQLWPQWNAHMSSHADTASKSFAERRTELRQYLATREPKVPLNEIFSPEVQAVLLVAEAAHAVDTGLVIPHEMNVVLGRSAAQRRLSHTFASWREYRAASSTTAPEALLSDAELLSMPPTIQAFEQVKWMESSYSTSRVALDLINRALALDPTNLDAQRMRLTLTTPSVDELYFKLSSGAPSDPQTEADIRWWMQSLALGARCGHARVTLKRSEELYHAVKGLVPGLLERAHVCADVLQLTEDDELAQLDILSMGRWIETRTWLRSIDTNELYQSGNASIFVRSVIQSGSQDALFVRDFMSPLLTHVQETGQVICYVELLLLLAALLREGIHAFLDEVLDPILSDFGIDELLALLIKPARLSYLWAPPTPTNKQEAFEQALALADPILSAGFGPRDFGSIQGFLITTLITLKEQQTY